MIFVSLLLSRLLLSPESELSVAVVEEEKSMPKRRMPEELEEESLLLVVGAGRMKGS